MVLYTMTLPGRPGEKIIVNRLVWQAIIADADFTSLIIEVRERSLLTTSSALKDAIVAEGVKLHTVMTNLDLEGVLGMLDRLRKEVVSA